MLLTRDLIKGVDEKYIPMLQKVNIPDFMKCISVLTGLDISSIADSVVGGYLKTWAENKYRFYKMFGDKLRLDCPISYSKQRDNLKNELMELELKFPGHALWLREFSQQTSNKINPANLAWSTRSDIGRYCPNCQIEGTTITHFFKKFLSAPDELVTEIGRMFENDTVNATYTLSIDPVDMMLASENPYNWTSCYRLETINDSSHADGCLAAVLDTSNIITYVWNKEGKYNLDGKFDFKSIRYKQMRRWVAISPNMTTLHFNEIYPGRDEYDDKFDFVLRDVVEQIVSKHKGMINKWRKPKWDESPDVSRTYRYGYGEYRSANVYVHSEHLPESWKVYDEPIYCACGCGTVLHGSDDDYEYIGAGFTCEAYEERWYCDLLDDYCTCCGEGGCCEENCADCDVWRDSHPVCDLTDDECEDPDYDYVSDGVMNSCEGHCWDCPHYQAFHSPDGEEEE